MATIKIMLEQMERHRLLKDVFTLRKEYLVNNTKEGIHEIGGKTWDDAKKEVDILSAGQHWDKQQEKQSPPQQKAYGKKTGAQPTFFKPSPAADESPRHDQEPQPPDETPSKDGPKQS